MGKIALNSGQKELKNLFMKWNRDPYKQTFELAGFAGTGKTYMAKKLLQAARLEFDQVLCIAFTGRAAANLSLKGIPASSIHSSIYEYVELPKLDEDGYPIYKHGRKLTMMGFKLRPFLPKHIKMILVDECYFVNKEIAKDILSFGIPVFVMGDNGQLPPIFGDPYFLVKPDYTLTELMRQAKDSGIVELATRIRLGQELPNKKCQIKNDTFIIPKREITDELLLNVEMILCATNKSRNYYNYRIREDIMGITAKLPTPKDKIICRSNMWNRILGGTPLVNGTIGNLVHNIDVTKIDAKARTAMIDFRPDYISHDYFENLPMNIDYFIQECGKKEENMWNRAAKIELGHALSVHISQGSEFDSVLFNDDSFGDSELIKRIRYTAVTRAKQILVYAI